MVVWITVARKSVMQRLNVTLECDSGFDFQEPTQGKQELTRKNGDKRWLSSQPAFPILPSLEANS